MGKFYLLVFIAVLTFSVIRSNAQSYTVRGELRDSTGMGIAGAAIVVMDPADSVAVNMEYTKEPRFEIKYDNPGKKEMLLYIQAYGYKNVLLDLKAEDENLGEIVLNPLSYDIDGIAVTADASVQYRSVRGKDEFTIPRSVGEREYDLNTLLSTIPGLAVDGEKVSIIGRGAPIYTINGLKPRPGELQNLSPRDVEKIVIDRMPSARYDKSVVGIINIVTRKTLKDYLGLRVSNDFYQRKEPGNISRITLNNQVGKWSNHLDYSYTYWRSYYESIYTNVLHDDDRQYVRTYTQSPLFRSQKHVLNYSPKYQINGKSFIDLQYSYERAGVKGSHPESFDILGYEYNSSDGSSFSRDNSHNVIARYVLEGDNDERLVINGGYSHILKNGNSLSLEKITYNDGTRDEILTQYDSRFASQVLSFSAMYDFGIGDNILAESGLEFAELWNDSRTRYKGGDKYLSDTEETQAAAYFNLGQQIGKFYYQIGVRGEYLYKYRAEGTDANSKPFSFLPTVSLGYDFSDAVNLTLYFRRTTTHPTLSERSPILNYVNKYEYTQGNPDLRSYIDNELSLHAKLPWNIAVNVGYFYAKDPIIQMDDIYDIETRKTIFTYHNFPKREKLSADITWNGHYGFYRLTLTGQYQQIFAKSPYLDGFVDYTKPRLQLRINQLFKLYRNIYLGVVFNCSTSYDNIYTRVSESYDLSGNIVMTLFKRRLNVTVGCDKILYSNQRTWEKYKMISTYNQNFQFDRQFRIGITYNFSNFRDLFKKNDSNADILQRAL